MPRTRASKPAASDSPDTQSTTKSSSSSKITLPPCTSSPPKVFILPKAASKEARIYTLPHPRHGKPSRYLVCPETGFYEFTKFTAPKDDTRSWMLETLARDGRGREAQVASSPDMFVATAMDPLFLVIPALVGSTVGRAGEEQKSLFLTSEDYFDKLPEEYSHLNEILRLEKPRSLLERRMAAVCDTVEAGDESMYRLNKTRLVSACLQKAKILAEGDSFPSSLEKQFVTKALQAPVLNQKRSVKPKALEKENLPPNETFESGTSTPPTESNDSQSTTATAETAATSIVEEGSEVVEAMTASPEIITLQKLRVSFELICERLISPTTTAWLKEELFAQTNFGPLDEYLAAVTKLRAEAVSSRSMGDYSRKHMRDEDDDEAREAKRRKADEEKKRKAGESRGVRDLKKVNTSGMMKLSAFFKKK